MINNPLCNNTNITIDSAFVDKYSDLGSDVITLFANTTAYQLIVETTDPIHPNFRYKRSQSLNEWSNYGSISPPIDVVYYKFINRSIIALLNCTVHFKSVRLVTLLSIDCKYNGSHKSILQTQQISTIKQVVECSPKGSH
ncbi:unnamed protein product [Medioppia subpectinata]|uniref:Uncharacterized protein n=1 Tax=Medioppia subpectinata TaxID=1979941 RepID=A0A7R9KL70_9ACAR|nr:unnamed protein product [Medioppia subpectinata]CAG2105642.1 unnamed protein product [Medioppia subpectinata]